MSQTIAIEPNGKVKFILTDKAQWLLNEGDAQVKRVSHVEPSTLNGVWKWYADLYPVAGPVLGPFETRKEALEEEVKWLEKNIIHQYPQ